MMEICGDKEMGNSYQLGAKFEFSTEILEKKKSKIPISFPHCKMCVPKIYGNSRIKSKRLSDVNCEMKKKYFRGQVCLDSKNATGALS